MLLYHERQWKVARKTKRAQWKGNSGSLDKVSIIQNRSKIELIEKTDIENAYHQENKLKITRIIGTLEMNRRLIEELGYLGNLVVYQ